MFGMDIAYNTTTTLAQTQTRRKKKETNNKWLISHQSHTEDPLKLWASVQKWCCSSKSGSGRRKGSSKKTDAAPLRLWRNETNHLICKAQRPPSFSKTINGRKKLLACLLAWNRNAQSHCVSSIDRIIEEPRQRRRENNKNSNKAINSHEGTLQTHKASSRYMTPKAHQQKASGS